MNARKRVARAPRVAHSSGVFGGICVRAGWLFLARGTGHGRVTVLDARRFEVLHDLALADEKGRPVMPAGLAVGDTFGIWVTDPRHRVVRGLTLFGQALGLLGEPGPPGLAQAPDRRGTIAEPVAVAVDSVGALYVASAGGPRVHAVQKYARSGRFLGSLRAFGVPGETFSSPRSIAIHEDAVYVADTGNSAVHVFRRNGSFWQVFSTAVRPGECSMPVSIAFEAAGTLLVLDRGHGPCLRRFSAGGDFLGTVLDHRVIDGPVSVAAHEGGTLFLLDHDGDRLRAFHPSGRCESDLIGVMESRDHVGARPGASYGRPL